MPDNPNDTIREQMLQYFHDRNANATSVRGKKGSQVKISDVKSELKAHRGLTQQQVISNLTYLLEQGWVTDYEEKKSFTTGGGATVPSTVDWYGISAAGIDLIEGGSSAFKPKDPFLGININAVQSTVQIGDGNYVNAQYQDASVGLEALREAIANSERLDDTAKLSAVSDIDTIKAQLTKPEPDKSIVQAAWSAVEKVGKLAGLGANLASIAAGLGGLL